MPKQVAASAAAAAPAAGAGAGAPTAGPAAGGNAQACAAGAVGADRYVVADGLRHVRPYEHTFRVHAKTRWLGRDVLSVLCGEFKQHARTYYEQALRDGRVTVNGTRVTGAYVMRNGDELAHTQMRAEPPVVAAAVHIIWPPQQPAAAAGAAGAAAAAGCAASDGGDDLVAVSKPSSWPVHPTGRYAHNTLLSILSTEYALPGLLPVNRLDRLTSGVTLLARTPAAAAKYGEFLKLKTLRKVYLTRVWGQFPAAAAAGDDAGAEGDVTVTQPIFCVNARLCKYDTAPAADAKQRTAAAGAGAKGAGAGGGGAAAGHSAVSHFRRVWYDAASNTSLVQCRPETGRTHQLRVHLRWLRHPIVGDAHYDVHTTAHLCPQSAPAPAAVDASAAAKPAAAAAAAAVDATAASTAAVVVRPVTTLSPLCICLHALSYASPDAGGPRFEAPAPEWARRDFVLLRPESFFVRAIAAAAAAATAAPPAAAAVAAAAAAKP